MSLKKNNKTTFEFRSGAAKRSQLIGVYGVGSIMDLPGESVMPAAVDLWPPNIDTIITDQRLQKRLKNFGINCFKTPPSIEEFNGGIPVIRFPKWLYCPNPKCGSLRYISEWRERYEKRRKTYTGIPRCDICGIKLVPSSFVVVCPRGHIDDFPWVNWTHKKTGICNKC